MSFRLVFAGLVQAPPLICVAVPLLNPILDLHAIRMRTDMNPRSSGQPRPLHVMHLLNKFGVGGMEVGITKLVNGLDPAKVVSSICSCRPGDTLKERLRPDVRLYEFNRREGNDPVWVLRLYSLLRRTRPDVLHTHRWATLCEGLLAARLAGVPYVVHGEHGTLETRSRNAPIQRAVWNRVDKVLSVSSRLAERMSGQIAFPLERIQVIRNGADLARFTPAFRAEARTALGLRAEELVIGTVGRLVPVKDQATMLRAFALLKAEGLSFTGILAGTGPLREQLEALALSLKLDNVRFLGNRDDVPQVLAAMDIFVLSSESEGLSNTIQEAMATSLPVIATHVGGADELVDHDQTGLLVPPRDPRRIADAIVTLTRDAGKRRQMASAAGEKARRQFGLERMLREYERMYLDLPAKASAVVAHVRTYEA